MLITRQDLVAILSALLATSCLALLSLALCRRLAPSSFSSWLALLRSLAPLGWLTFLRSSLALNCLALRCLTLGCLTLGWLTFLRSSLAPNCLALRCLTLGCLALGWLTFFGRSLFANRHSTGG